MFKMTLETAQINITLYNNYVNRDEYQIGVIGDRLVKYHKPKGLLSHLYDRICLIFDQLLAFLSFGRLGVCLKEEYVIDKMLESEYVLVFEYYRNKFSAPEMQEILSKYETNGKEATKGCATLNISEEKDSNIPLELLTTGC